MPDGFELTVPLPLASPVLLTVRTKRCRSKVAVTSLDAFMVTVHVVPDTVSQPFHPANVDPLAALAVSVTLVPVAYGSEQSPPQLMPGGFELTLPVPAPAWATDRVGGESKVAVTVLDAFMVTVQVVPDAVSQPFQPAKIDPLAALAVSVTLVPVAYGSEQSPPQLIPGGFELTLPVPVPVRATDRVGGESKVAVTVLDAFMVTVHVV